MQRSISYIIAMLCIFSASAQKSEKMRGILLDSVMVKGERRSLLMRKAADGATVWDMEMMADMPKIMGNADPVHYAQMLPGVQTNNEYQGGIHVQGSDNEHNEMAVNGVPLYNVNHLLGFFSAFNATHYQSMSLTESAQSAAFANRLGASLNMETRRQQPDSVSADVSVGLISSQGTLRMPTSKRASLTLSARASYINALYSSWLKADDYAVRYSFYDLNATYDWRIDNKNSIMVDAYLGGDNAKMDDNNYQANVADRWGNAMAAVHWNHDEGKKMQMRTSMFVTSYSNDLSLGMAEYDYGLRSRITSYGARSNIQLGDVSCGGELMAHSITPMRIKGEGRFNTTQTGNESSTSAEASLYADYKWWFTPAARLDAGVRATAYRHGSHTFASANPSACFTYFTHDTKWTLAYSMRHQYISQTGFSDTGLPTEFWLPASKDNVPQRAHGFTAKSETYLFGRRYQLSLSAYYKWLYHQTEYGGTVLDLVNKNYDLGRSLLHGSGHNYGATVMLSKCTGKLTGWVCYSYGKAERTFVVDGEKDTYPANHDRTHEVNMVATYSASRHWSFGATMTACSGTPFTAPKCFYFINGNVMTQMGRHNGNRLSQYARLDVSVNYKWQTRHGHERGLNLSLYNVMCHNNDLFHFVRVNKNNEVYYKSVHFISPILPSVSYFVKI